ncbi:MAG TPA: hypothetical protein VK324_02470 [Tepidisphaeraceae bacterium]|nr:hypothetical protein [Tepidisphaeraceae bacterium]
MSTTTTRRRSAKKPMTLAERRKIVNEVRGKYKHLKTSSAKFAAAKAAEIRLEDRRR